MSPESTTKRRLRWIHVVDVLLVASASWTAFNFVRPSWEWPVTPAKQAPFIAPEQKLSLPGVNWAAKSRHVVLAFTTSCKFCLQSGSFYKQVSEWVATHPNEEFIVVSPEPTSGIEQWMRQQGVNSFRHVKENFHLHGFRLTPTIALVDRTGTVTDIAVGLLSEVEEKQVFARLDGKSGTPLAIRYTGQAISERTP